MDIVVFVIVLSVLIVIHEFGHFLVARKSGVRVEKFAIGFGKELLKIKGKETDFSICLFPLGGYVKLAGENRAELKGADNEFFSQPASTRIKIVFAGPLFNYILAFMLFWLIAMLGFPYHDNVVGKVLDGYPAKEAGVKENDRIVEVNGKKVADWYDLTSIVYKSREKVNLKIERDGKTLALEVPVKKSETGDEFGRKKQVSMMGIASKIRVVKYNFFEAFVKAGNFLFEFTVLTVKGIALMVAGTVPARDIAGPLGIYQITSDAVKIGVVAVLYLMAVLNINLAIINLLPIPVLDGGHIFLFLLEKLRKKPLSEKTENRITRVGLTVISLLFVFLMYNDLSRIVDRVIHKKTSNAEQHAPLPNNTGNRK